MNPIIIIGAVLLLLFAGKKEEDILYPMSFKPDPALLEKLKQKYGTGTLYATDETSTSFKYVTEGGRYNLTLKELFDMARVSGGNI